ncbi:MAG TPA: Dam family site-specific DNA-(adenine-N6)-methyltransferase [Terriglobales bacterium]|nr:Dam family site-specific DNA-(adenine-N6)-methyltransferase [Terriglobales bacterium]
MKWPGGKRRLLHLILPHLGRISGGYFEPFIGGGAVFFALKAARSVIGDTNPEVTNCYRQIQSNVDNLIQRLRRLENSEHEYYRIREWEPLGDVDRAARMLYLTRLSFNGIYRQNLKGKFNVPYGYKKHLQVVEEDHLKAIQARLRKTVIRTGDFAATAGDAVAGDTVYFDPPYTVAHGNNGFVKYNARIFSWEDQRRLAAFANRLVQRGCRVVVSNADHASIDELYPYFKRFRIERPSVIAADAEFRKVVTESVFVGPR